MAALVDGAEYKRRQSPPGVRITAKAFGKDRRMPITNRYRDPAPEATSASRPGRRPRTGCRPACLTASTRCRWRSGPGGLDGVGAVGTGPALALEVQARLVGSYQWVERRLFEVLGSWVGSEPVPEAQVLFDVYSQQHAWHAELFADRLPALDSVDPATLMVPPSAEVDRMLGVLAGGGPRRRAPGADGGPHRRATGGDVPAGGHAAAPRGHGPRGAAPAGHRLHAAISVGCRPSPTRRCTAALRLVLRDEVEQWQAVEALTQALLRRPTTWPWCGGHQQRLEADHRADPAPGSCRGPLGSTLRDAGRRTVGTPVSRARVLTGR